MKIIVPTKYKDKQTTRNKAFEAIEGKEKDDFEEEKDRLNKETVYHKTEMKEVIKDKKELRFKLAIENVIRKILEHKINLTLEEMLSVFPTFIHKLKGISLDKKGAMKSFNTLEIKEYVISIKIKDFEKPRPHYAFPLGLLKVFVGKVEYPIMALVDT
ncbi:hypothetical protein O181_116444 [Austropuccinia psidii MF-1]|uniref:Uncharacterized protein n=1 Tax=Austropuccinia psidii MF-1 TaxID=1389203 RepID=A0A9Q3KBG6_9BASI|nr:hypothetical protein [Austropuccinia psidii MF-1]